MVFRLGNRSKQGSPFLSGTLTAAQSHRSGFRRRIVTVLVMVALAAALHVIVARYVAELVAPARAFSDAVLVLSETPNEFRLLLVRDVGPPGESDGRSTAPAASQNDIPVPFGMGNTRAWYERHTLCVAGAHTGAFRRRACEEVEDALGRWTTVGALIMHRDAELHRGRVTIAQSYGYDDDSHDLWGFLRELPPIRRVVESTDSSGTRIVRRLRPTVAATQFIAASSARYHREELHVWHSRVHYSLTQCSDLRFDRFMDVEGTLQLQVRQASDATSPDVQILQTGLPEEIGACVTDIWREYYPRRPSWGDATLRITYSFYTVVDEPGPLR